MQDLVLIRKDEGVATLTMNRPDSRNALNTALLNRLGQAVAEVTQDPEVRVIILTGAGSSFCAGGDIKQGTDEPNASSPGLASQEAKPLTIDRRIARLRAQMEAARLLHQSSKPTIAMIRGAAVGAGLSLAGACDLRIASDNAVLMTGFLPHGFGGDFGGTFFWTRTLGSARARELYLLSEKLEARVALEMGMLTRVVPDAKLEEVVDQIARQLASRLSSAIHYAKCNLNLAEHGTLEEVLDAEATNMVLAVQAAAAAHKARNRAEKPS